MAVADKVPKHIADYHNGRHELSLEIKEDADIILEAIDLDELLSNPSDYLELVGSVFLEKHQDKFIKAFDMGRKHGDRMSDG